MRTLFADTCYWIALLNPRDQLHARAVRVSQSLTAARIMTTDEVLTEFLNYFGDRGILLRQAATRMAAQIQVDGRIHIEAAYRPDPERRIALMRCPRIAQITDAALKT